MPSFLRTVIMQELSKNINYIFLIISADKKETGPLRGSAASL